MSATTLDGLPVAIVDGRRRRWPRRLALLALVVVVALAIGAAWTDLVYRPLATQGESVQSPTTRWSAKSGIGGHLVVDYRQGAPFRLSILVSNDGRWPVTITDPGTPGASVSLFHIDAVSMGNTEGALTPFHAVSVPSKGTLQLVYRGTLDGCGSWSPGTSETITAVTISYRAFGLTHRAILDLAPQIQLLAPAAGRCPSRN